MSERPICTRDHGAAVYDPTRPRGGGGSHATDGRQCLWDGSEWRVVTYEAALIEQVRAVVTSYEDPEQNHCRVWPPIPTDAARALLDAADRLASVEAYRNRCGILRVEPTSEGLRAALAASSSPASSGTSAEGADRG